MKTKIKFSVLAVQFLALAALSSAQQQDSLGDYARNVRHDKNSPAVAKKYDNDNLPVNDKLSVVGNAADSKSDAANTADDASKPGAAATKDSADKSPSSAEALKATNDEWKNKISGEKDQIELLARELDVATREQRQEAAAFYADAGARLRDPGDWDKKVSATNDEIAKKQKALDEAKQKLEAMQEDARKAGVPSSERE